MSPEKHTPESAVDRFFEKLAEPAASEGDVDRSGERMLKYLEAQYRNPRRRPVHSPRIADALQWLRWPVVAAVVMVFAIGVILLRIDPDASVAGVEEGTVEVFASGGSRTAGAGEKLESDQPLKTGATGAMLTLSDGSHVELSSKAEFSIVRTADGLELGLAGGTAIVTAAKQRSRRHLDVRTRDCTVSVTGTVFVVRAEEEGSRVSVLEGQVRFQQAEIVKTLSPGEQVATSPIVGIVPVLAEIEWSRNAAQLATLLQSPAPAAPPEVGSIEGVVTNVVTGEPLPDVVVYFQSRGSRPQVQREARTTRDGRFTIDKVPEGIYLLVGSKAGFWMPDFPPPALAGLAHGFTVTVPSAQPLHIRMIPASSIAGRVQDENGAPVRALSLTLWHVTYTGEGHASLVLAKNTGATGGITDERGEYQFTDVFPGEYYVKTAPDPSHEVPAYYPGVSFPDRAVPLVVRPGVPLTGITLALPQPKLYSIRLKSPQGLPAWAANVKYEGGTQQAGPRSALFTITLQPNGKFREVDNFASHVRSVGSDEYVISRVPSGRYHLSLTWAGTPTLSRTVGILDVPTVRTHVEVEITDRDVDLGRLSVKPLMSIPVRITFADGVRDDVTLIAHSLSRLGSAGRLVGSPPNPLTLGNLSDVPYALNFTLPADRYVALARYGGQDVLSYPLIVDSADRGALEIVIDGPAGSVEGILRNAKNEPVGNTQVVLIPPAYRRGNPHLFRTTATDHNGAFKFTGVPPGDYGAYSWESTPGDAFKNAEWLREYETRGVPVNVRGGLTTNANVRVIPGVR